MITQPDAAKPIGLLVLLWLVGWTLRVPILSAPPLSTRMADDFGLGETGVGALTMLPIVAVAFAAIPAALVIGRLGLRWSIAGGVLLMAVASVSRGYVPGATQLFLATLIMGIGVAVFQTALPAATRIWTPRHVALASAVYLNGMMVGEFSGAGLTLPVVLPLAGDDWRLALSLWAIPIIGIGVLVAVVRLPSEEQCEPEKLTQKRTLPKLNDAAVWQFGVMLASATIVFYAINAYAGTILRARGEPGALEGLLFAFNLAPLVASLFVMARPSWLGQRTPMAIWAILGLIGLIAFGVLNGMPAYVGAFVAGVASTVHLILLMSMPAIIAKGAAVTRLAAGMTLVGLTIAVGLSLLGGFLADQTGLVEASTYPAIVFALLALLAVGRSATYPEYD